MCRRPFDAPHNQGIGTGLAPHSQSVVGVRDGWQRKVFVMTQGINAKQNLSYERPQLAVYGSVRNLTGGSNGKLGDGKTNRAKA